MSLETAFERKRKRIVEHTIGHFDNAYEAITFGNTVNALVQKQLGKIKFRQYIGSPHTSLAITNDYDGDTVLKTQFMEVLGTEAARHVCKLMNSTCTFYNMDNNTNVTLMREIIRDKPQPQFIGR